MCLRFNAEAEEPSPTIEELSRAKSTKGNLAWVGRALKKMGNPDLADWTLIALVGGRDLMASRIRFAQSLLRDDGKPSAWSDVLVLTHCEDDLNQARATHVPLLQPQWGPFAGTTNGVVVVPLSDFDDQDRWPNVALIALPIPEATLLERIWRFGKMRGQVDVLEHVLRWLAFAWGVSRPANPIVDGVGLPSACMLEVACAAAQYDLTPGLESRASCPEAIWAMVRRWHTLTADQTRLPKGCFVRDHVFDITD